MEKILAKREGKDQSEYLIKWKGYEREEDKSWEKEGNLVCDQMVQLFEEKYKE